MTKTPRLTSALMLAVFLLSAGVASAASYRSDLDRSDFLNDGYVAEGETLSISHVFDPVDSVASVESVLLFVTVTDDFNCASFSGCLIDWMMVGETAEIELNNYAWQEGSATNRTFYGDVTSLADIDEAGDVLVVDLISTDGDFQAWSSSMFVDYTSGGDSGGGAGLTDPSNAMPEPRAALVFLLGGMIVSAGMRRQLRRS